MRPHGEGGRVGPPRGPARPSHLAFADSGPPPMAVPARQCRHATPAGVVHAGSTPLAAPTHTSRRPHLSPPTPFSAPLHRPAPTPFSISPPLSPLGPPSPHSHLPTHISPLTSPHSHLPTHILEPPVRQDAKPATARRLGSHVPCGPKSGVDPPRCFAGGALFRVGPHSLPVSATAHAAPPSLPSLPQQLLSQASPRHLPGISPAASHEVRTSLTPPTPPPDTLAGAGEPAGDGDIC